MKIPIRFISLAISLFAFGCSTTRTLKDGEYLFLGNQMEVNAPEGTSERSVERTLKTRIRQETNRKFLGLIPFRLWFYNLPGDSIPERGLRHWIREDLGEPPVLFRSSQTEATEERMGIVLENMGYFHYQITPLRETRRRKLKMVYQVELDEPYVIRNLKYPAVEDTFTGLLNSYRTSALIEDGSVYNLEILEKERARVIDRLRRNGYYYVRPDHLYFEVDTLSSERMADLELTVKMGLPPEARKVQTIHRVFVHHGVSAGIRKEPGDTLLRNGIHHIHPGSRELQFAVLERSVFLTTGNRYDVSDYRRTLRRLTGLGIFQFVQIRFMASEADRTGINAHIYLTHQDKYRLQAEFQAVSKSTDFVGPGLKLSFVQKNLRHTASSFRIDLDGSFETQLNRASRGINTWESGLHGELDLPRILAPGFFEKQFRENPYTPKTRIRAGYNYFDRGNFFTLHSLNGSFGYRWDQTSKHAYELKVFSLDYLRMTNVSPDVTGSNLLRRAYDEQFILMANFGFTLNDLALQKRINHYLHFSAESAGNTLSLIDAIRTGESTPDGTPSEFFGIPYAQYARIHGDYRVHLKLSSLSKFVVRSFIGVGIPYGNSQILPYKKRFYSGGTTSLRAFPSRSVGPGSYLPDEEVSAESFYEQTGDIKLELNLEYRFDIYRFLKGAFFADAGNIWLVRKNPDISSGEFRFDRFLGQIAAGPGAGLRLDFSVLVLRMDVAFPVRKPYLSENERWVFREIDFSSPGWRKDNLVFNLAIGYPF